MIELAEKSKHAAFSQQRELAAQDKAIEVSRANDVMRATLERLSDERDLLTFPNMILREAMKQTGSDDGAIFVFDPETNMFRATDLVLDPESNDEVTAALSQPHPLVPEGQFLLKREAPVIFDLINEGDMLPVGAAQWHLSRGNLCVIMAPMFVSRELYGLLGFAYRKPAANISSVDLGLIQALSQQVSLAVQLSRLADESRRADLARERERAAREREAELSIANGVLRATLEQLSDERDLRTFPSTILKEAMKQIGASDGAYSIFNAEKNLLQTTEVVLNPITVDAFTQAFLQGLPAGPDCAAVIANRAPLAFDVELDSQMFPAGAADWHRGRGTRSTIIAPIFVNGEPHGFLGFALKRSVDTISKVDLGLIQALTQQVSLAIQLTRLAEKSKRADLAQERERAAQEREAELSMANDILRATLEHLFDEPDLGTFPRMILRESMKQLGALDGVLFAFDAEANTLRAVNVVTNPVSEDEFIQSLFRGISASSAFETALSQRAPVAFDVERDGDRLGPGVADWHRKRGSLTAIIAPIFVSSEPYGFFGFALRAPKEDVSKLALGVIESLTQQVGLAVQLTRLADRSKEAALAQERERDAEVRAAELANANEVLRSTLELLAEESDLHSFPRTILKEAMHQTGANDGLILSFSSTEDTLSPMVYICSENPNAEAPPEFRRSFPAKQTKAWNALVKARAPIIFDVEDDAAMLLPGLGAWHRSRGNKSIIAAPMFIGGEPYGYFGITLPQRAAKVSQINLGLTHALAQQATLAIQLTQLAEVSQKTAITLERQQVIVQERSHMAREIHDKLAQGYAAILIQQKALRRSIKTDSGSLIHHLDIIERLSKENLAEARRTMANLNTNDFEPGSLHRAIHGWMDQINVEADFAVSVLIETELPPVPRYVEAEVGRVIGEALSNARRHSRAESASMIVQHLNGSLTITIKDEGIGFDLLTASPSFGIPSMHERAARAGAELEITSMIGRGTQVRLTLGK